MCAVRAVRVGKRGRRALKNAELGVESDVAGLCLRLRVSGSGQRRWRDGVWRGSGVANGAVTAEEDVCQGWAVWLSL